MGNPSPQPPPPERYCPMCGAQMRLADRGVFVVLYACLPCRVMVEYPLDGGDR